MAANHVQKGDVLSFLNETAIAITSGSPVVVGDRVGVALVAIAPDESGSVAMSEVFSISKEAEAIAQGKKVYLNSNAKITATATNNTLAGYSFAGALSGDATIPVKLNG